MSESPKPEPVIPSVGPRARVSNHMRHLLTVGATSLTLACPPLVCDPLPPPAMCKSTGSVLSSLQVSVSAVSGGAVVDLVVTSRDTMRPEAVTLTFTNATGGTAVLQAASGSIIRLRVTPTSVTSVVELAFTAACDGTAATGIRIVLTPRALDGGALDGGADGGTSPYDVSVREQ